MTWFREWLAFWLLDKVLRLLPVTCTTRQGMLRGLREQRDYDRYAAYCELQRTPPMPFLQWREVRQSLQVRVKSAEQANAVLRSVGRPTFQPAVSRL